CRAVRMRTRPAGHPAGNLRERRACIARRRTFAALAVAGSVAGVATAARTLSLLGTFVSAQHPVHVRHARSFDVSLCLAQHATCVRLERSASTRPEPGVTAFHSR